MDNRVSVISIIIKEEESIGAVNELLHEFREYIVGRMGIPIETAASPLSASCWTRQAMPPVPCPGSWACWKA